jgi:hypothetical protein
VFVELLLLVSLPAIGAALGGALAGAVAGHRAPPPIPMNMAPYPPYPPHLFPDYPGPMPPQGPYMQPTSVPGAASGSSPIWSAAGAARVRWRHRRPRHPRRPSRPSRCPPRGTVRRHTAKTTASPMRMP